MMAEGREERMTTDCRLGNSFLSCRTGKKSERREEIKKGGCGVVCHYTKNRIYSKKNTARIVLFFIFSRHH